MRGIALSMLLLTGCVEDRTQANVHIVVPAEVAAKAIVDGTVDLAWQNLQDGAHSATWLARIDAAPAQDLVFDDTLAQPAFTATKDNPFRFQAWLAPTTVLGEPVPPDVPQSAVVISLGSVDSPDDVELVVELP